MRAALAGMPGLRGERGDLGLVGDPGLPGLRRLDERAFPALDGDTRLRGDVLTGVCIFFIFWGPQDETFNVTIHVPPITTIHKRGRNESIGEREGRNMI